MDEKEFQKKYVNLRILKSIQDYLKPDGTMPKAVYPINVPYELVYQISRTEGVKKCDELIHQIFKMGLSVWSEKLYNNVFGSQKNLEEFIELVKKRKKT